jgi:hypothetical protein
MYPINRGQATCAKPGYHFARLFRRYVQSLCQQVNCPFLPRFITEQQQSFELGDGIDFIQNEPRNLIWNIIFSHTQENRQQIENTPQRKFIPVD